MYFKILCIITVFGIQLPGFGQSKESDQKIDLSVNELPLSEVLKSITQKSGIEFTFSSSAIPVNELISINKKNISVKKAIQLVIKNLPITYDFLGGRCVLKRLNLTQTIKGKITDDNSSQPLIGVNVKVTTTRGEVLGAVTDLEGQYSISNVPIGRVTIEISFIGFETREYSDLLLTSAKQLVFNTSLNESDTELDEILIQAKRSNFSAVNRAAQISARSFSIEETKRYAASLGDPSRLATVFPGVTQSGNDLSNDITIRGNASKGMLWQLEGVEIPSPNHFSTVGGASGALSIFSSQVLSRSDFLTGAFPSQYGNALSGVFDVHFRNGNAEKREHTFQAGFLGFDVASEGPFIKGKKATYLFNYRYSTLGLVDQLGFSIADETKNNGFQDLSLKLYFPTKKLGTFSLFGIGGLSKFSFGDDEDDDTGQSYDVGMLGLKHQIPLSNKTALTSTLSFAGNKAKSGDATLQRFLTANDNINTYIKNNSSSYYRAKTVLQTKLSAKHTIEGGAVYSVLGYRFNRRQVLEESEDSQNPVQSYDQKGNTSTLQSYLNWSYNINSKFRLVTGVHGFYFNLNKETLLQPRASLRYSINNKHTVVFGYGEHSKLESLELYVGGQILNDGSIIQNNRDVKISKARHFVLGYDTALSKNLRFKVELYHQQLFDIPVIAGAQPNTAEGVYSSLLNDFEFDESFQNLPLSNSGTGTNTGIELTLEKQFSDGYYFMTNASFYDSKYKGGDGIKRNSRLNGNYSINALGGKEWMVGKAKKNILGLNSKILYAGNNRFFPLDLQESINQQQTIFDYDRAYKEQLPYYLRFDVQISYIKNNPKTTHELRLDIQNILARKNAASRFYDTETGKIEFNNQTGFFPILSYRIQF